MGAVGARCHGWSGTWLSLVKECLGSHNQVQATIDAYLDDEAFDKMPFAPPGLLKHGTCVMLVSRQEGTLVSVARNLLEELPSFHKAILGHCHVGEHFPKTVDLFTSPGQVLLASSDAKQLEADFARIHEVSDTELFTLTTVFRPLVEFLRGKGYIFFVQEVRTGLVYGVGARIHGRMLYRLS